MKVNMHLLAFQTPSAFYMSQIWQKKIVYIHPPCGLLSYLVSTWRLIVLRD